MQNDYVDISFTVLDRVRQGRRLLRDLNTGQIYYDPPEPVVEPELEPVVEKEPEPIFIHEGWEAPTEENKMLEPAPNPAPHKPKAKKLHHG